MGLRLLQMPGMPALLVSAATAVAFALWDPPVRDLAAHTFRAEFFEQYGPAIWNGTWYGGHYMPTYSVLFPPLAALLDPVWAAGAGGDRLRMAVRQAGRRALGPARRAGGAVVRGARRPSPCSRTAGWRSPWALALALASLLRACSAAGTGRLAVRGSLRPGEPRRGPAAGAGRRDASPSPGVAAARRSSARVWRSRRSPSWRCLFPEAGGEFPLWFSAYWPLALTCVGALLCCARLPEERTCAWSRPSTSAAGTLLWLVPNPVGGNITRLGSLFAGPVLAAVLLARPGPAAARTGGRGARPWRSGGR